LGSKSLWPINLLITRSRSGAVNFFFFTMEALGVALECECSRGDVFVIEKDVKHRARSLRVPIHFFWWLYLGFKYFFT
jgi:hypothetical protein